MRTISEAWRGNLYAEGCLTGKVAFSPGTQPTHGDLTRRKLRQKKKKKEIAGLSFPTSDFLLVFPRADPILEASGKATLSKRRMLMTLFIILYSPPPTHKAFFV